ncbi:MAG: hypothetical protein R2773_04780 [Flavobacteriaceae bacterium]
MTKSDEKLQKVTESDEKWKKAAKRVVSDGDGLEVWKIGVSLKNHRIKP